MPEGFADGVVLVKGWFSDTVPKWLSETEGEIAFIHIDSDLYESAKEILALLNERIVPGTVIVFDELCDFDQTYPNWKQGEWKALLEWLDTGRQVSPIGRTDHQQVAFVVEK